MNIKSYLDSKPISVEDAAKMFGVHVSSVYRWINGDRKPDGDCMAIIFEKTKGAVTPADFKSKGGNQ
jgi:DNA-binding transcriptional regulator YdaS (Cro superfamily)